MAACEQGYLCDVCGLEVEDITDSDLYLRYVTGDVPARALMTTPERHLRCNPTLAQFIVHETFAPVHVEGMFGKQNLDAVDVARREEFITRGFLRLQEVRSLGLPISEYPLAEIRSDTTQ